MIWAGMSGLQGLGQQEVGEPGEVRRAESEGPGCQPKGLGLYPVDQGPPVKDFNLVISRGGPRDFPWGPT